ncbi:hypothetical protein BVX98_05825 [bacterium F11]|nr:hypothetical protein BVX98_05825 [bacterium F11]
MDTKDFCVIWGENLKTEDFRKVKYKNGSWTCYVKWPAGVSFDLYALSNNHLITDSDSIRNKIETVRKGDQVHISGNLVNYREVGNPYWRNSSQSRKDMGNGACEVLFVEKLEILNPGTPLWYTLFQLSLWMIGIIPLIKLIFFNMENRKIGSGHF